MLKATDRPLEKWVQIVSDERRWKNSTEEELGMALGVVVSAYGFTNDESLVPLIRRFYTDAVLPRVGRTWRQQLIPYLANQVLEGKLSANTLMVTIFSENDVALIAEAALNMIAVHPMVDGDKLAGVRSLVHYARTIRSEVTRIGIVGGLLLTGDRRVIDLLGPAWRQVEPSSRGTLAEMRTAFLHAPVIDWYLDWLEDCEGGEFGAVAGALYKMAMSSEPEGAVLEVRRTIPVNDPEGNGEEWTILQRYTPSEFGQRIAPRLRALRKRESGNRVMPLVCEVWGVE